MLNNGHLDHLQLFPEQNLIIIRLGWNGRNG